MITGFMDLKLRLLNFLDRETQRTVNPHSLLQWQGIYKARQNLFSEMYNRRRFVIDYLFTKEIVIVFVFVKKNLSVESKKVIVLFYNVILYNTTLQVLYNIKRQNNWFFIYSFIFWVL